jgi:hypothetical protein
VKVAFFKNAAGIFLNTRDAGTLDQPYINKKGKLQPPALLSYYVWTKRTPKTLFDRSMEIEASLLISTWEPFVVEITE